MKKLVLNAHPFLYTLVSLLFFYMQVRWETLPTEIFRPLLVLWLVNIALFPLLYKLLGSFEWAAVLLTVFVLGFYYEKTVFIIVFLTSVSSLLLFVLAFWLVKRRFHSSIYH